MNLRPILKELAVVFAAGTLALVLCETYLRTFSPQQLMSPAFAHEGISTYRANAVIKHYHPPYFEALYTTNALGLRGPDYGLIKRPKVYRIISLGGSFTFGLGVNDEETYSRVLEKRLNALPRKRHVYQVMNFGMSRSSFVSYEAQFNRLLVKYKPDMMLVYQHPALYQRSGVEKDNNLGEQQFNAATSFVVKLLRSLRRVPGYTMMCETSNTWAALRLRAATTLKHDADERLKATNEPNQPILEKLYTETLDSFVKTVDGAITSRGLHMVAVYDHARMKNYPIIDSYLNLKAKSTPSFHVVNPDIDHVKHIYSKEGHLNKAGHAYMALKIAEVIALRVEHIDIKKP